MGMSFRVCVKDKVVTRTVSTSYYGTGSYSYDVNNKLLNEYKQWCKEKVGANGWNYFGQYRNIPYEFRFKKAEDLLAFKLTFGV